MIRRLIPLLLCLALLCSCAAPPQQTPSDENLPADEISDPSAVLPDTGKEESVPPPSENEVPDVTPLPEPEPEPIPEPVPEPVPEPEPEPTPPPEPVLCENLHILMYHNVAEDDAECDDWTVTVSRLLEDLLWLRDNGYTTVLPRELAAGENLPEKPVLIIFDDGYASNYRLAFPLFQELEAKAAISMITGNQEIGRETSLTWDMCREMAQSGLFEFGCHTHNVHLTEENGIQRLPEETEEDYAGRVLADLEKNISEIETNLETQVTFFAHPYGKTEELADAFLQEHFLLTVTSQPSCAGKAEGLFNLPRYNVTMNHPVSYYFYHYL